MPWPTSPQAFVRHARSVATVAGLVAAMSVSPRLAHAQALGDLAAWDGLVVSPVGAVPSVVGPQGRDGIVLRYGRWRYDADDAIHDDVGLTLFRQVGPHGTRVSVTGGWLSLSCNDCQPWLSGGLDVETPLYARQLAGNPQDGVVAELSLRLSGGGARYLGDGHAVGYSAAVLLPLSISAPVAGGSRVALGIAAGAGVGRLSSADNDAYGTLRIVGVGARFAFANGIVLEANEQWLALPRAPAQLGLSLGWTRQ